MNKQLLSAAAGIAVIVCASSVSAAIVDVKYTGSVVGGTDFGGIFGTPGADLSGAVFAADFVFDTTKGITSSPIYPNYNRTYGGPVYSSWAASPALQWSVTINGKTSAEMDGGYGGQIMGASSYPYEQNQQYQEAYSSNGSFLYLGMANAFAMTAGDIPATIDDPFTFNLGPNDFGYGLMSITDSTGATAEAGFLPTTLTYTVDSVPELSTWMMLVLGFAGLGVAGYRSRRSAVAPVL